MGDQYFKYWGKSKKRADEGYDYHLLPYHCLDVAAVGKTWLESNRSFTVRMADACGLSTEAFCCWFLFFLTLHDLGKFSVRFQNLCPYLLKKLQDKTSKTKYEPRHDQLGWEVFSNTLFDVLCVNEFSQLKSRAGAEEFLNIVAFCFLGHHGIPPKQGKNYATRLFDDDDLAAAEQFFFAVKKMFLSHGPLAEMRGILKLGRVERKEIMRRLKQKTWELAGLVTICDWVGSGENFTYCHEEIALETYFTCAAETAKGALQQAEVIPAHVSRQAGLKRLFPAFCDSPTPLQKHCNEAEIPEGPQLWILEDVTGAGKTEAAMVLVSRILAAGGGDGCFVALPTMATSNAMYERMARVYHLLFEENEKPSLVLSHGSRHLSELFSKSYKDGFTNLPDDPDVDKKGVDEGAAHCAQWLANSSKKALLADCGVGTVDQVLLSGLPVKYQSLRTYGLGRKVLVVDEVHAYDAYMLRQLENIIGYHASCGGSTILMSATLPLDVRRKFVTAYTKAAGLEDTPLQHEEFPLVTSVGRKGCCEVPVETRDEVKRDTHVSFCYEADDVYRIINENAAAGTCVCWIRNTISDVMQAYTTICEDGNIDANKIDIFHSRLAMHDRLNVENRIVRLFGKESGAVDRGGRIVIATQVIEQSLDLDFDVLISDLAPVDLLIQRAGRLHRHRRNAMGDIIGPGANSDRPEPVMYIYAPPVSEGPTANWYKEVFPHGQYVYKDTATLWRSFGVLEKERALRMPHKARALIESVYGAEKLDVPEVFLQAEGESWADAMARKSMADFNTLDFDSGYCSESSPKNLWDVEERVSSRIGELQNMAYLCRVLDGNLMPLYDDEKYPWDMSSLKIRKSLLQRIDCTPETQKLIDELQKQRRFKYDTLFIVFEGDALKATGEDDSGRRVEIEYDSVLGLRVTK